MLTGMLPISLANQHLKPSLAGAAIYTTLFPAPGSCYVARHLPVSGSYILLNHATPQDCFNVLLVLPIDTVLALLKILALFRLGNGSPQKRIL